jgi:hypothetical protein
MASTGRFFPVQTVWLGRTGSLATFNEPSLQFPGQLGAIVEDAGKVYRLVQFDNGSGNVASIAGGVVHWKTRASSIVTSDQTDAEAGINSVAGATLGVITDQYYCYVQIGGLQSVKTATVSAGGVAVGGATDNTFAITAMSTAPIGLPYAVAYGSDSGGFASFYWTLGALL